MSASAPSRAVRARPPARSAAERQGLVLRCSSCPAVFPVTAVGELRWHTFNGHARLASVAERTPVDPEAPPAVVAAPVAPPARSGSPGPLSAPADRRQRLADRREAEELGLAHAPVAPKRKRPRGAGGRTISKDPVATPVPPPARLREVKPVTGELVGPRRVTSTGARNRMVSIPSTLAEVLGLEKGDSVWWVRHPDTPNALVLMTEAGAAELGPRLIALLSEESG